MDKGGEEEGGTTTCTQDSPPDRAGEEGWGACANGVGGFTTNNPLPLGI